MRKKMEYIWMFLDGVVIGISAIASSFVSSWFFTRIWEKSNLELNAMLWFNGWFAVVVFFCILTLYAIITKELRNVKEAEVNEKCP